MSKNGLRVFGSNRKKRIELDAFESMMTFDEMGDDGITRRYHMKYSKNEHRECLRSKAFKDFAAKFPKNGQVTQAPCANRSGKTAGGKLEPVLDRLTFSEPRLEGEHQERS